MADAVAGRRAAVLGSPIAHSLSPALHRAAYAQLGLNWTYDAFEVDEAGLPAFIAGLDLSWAGLSLTMPLKERVIDLLDDVDDVAASVRAVNTVVPYGTRWRGTNTDVTGMVRALQEAGAAADLRTATLLGTGATARSAIAALAQLGVAFVTVCGRSTTGTRSMVLLAEAFGIAAVAAELAPDLRAVEVDDGGTALTIPGGVGVFLCSVFVSKKKRTINKLEKTDHRRYKVLI